MIIINYTLNTTSLSCINGKIIYIIKVSKSSKNIFKLQKNKQNRYSSFN